MVHDAFAQEPGTPPPLDVTTVGAQTSLAPYLAYLRDPGGQLTLADVEAPSTAARFAAFGDTFPNLGPTSDAIWVRLALTNPLTETVPLVLHLDAPTTSYVDLYRGLPASDRQPVVATGARRPYDVTPYTRAALCHPDRRTGGGNKQLLLAAPERLPDQPVGKSLAAVGLCRRRRSR